MRSGNCKIHTTEYGLRAETPGRRRISISTIMLRQQSTERDRHRQTAAPLPRLTNNCRAEWRGGAGRGGAAAVTFFRTRITDKSRDRRQPHTDVSELILSTNLFDFGSIISSAMAR